jgi:autotransporter-associated beta strand protein
MKAYPSPFNRFSSFLTAAALAFPAKAMAVTWQWDGGATTSNWQTAANWSPDALNTNFNGTFADRLNVNGAQLLEYTASEGVTNYGTTGVRGLVVGSGTSGTMTISGGTFSSLNATGTNSGDIIGNVNGAVGILNISGGTFIGASTGTNLGIGTGTGRVSTLNVSSGKATIATLNLNSSDADVNLSGTGELEVNTITMTGGSTGNISFNGGTLRARTTTTTFMQGLTGATVNGGGVTVDSNNFNITIGQALLVGSGSGGLTKTGAGILTLTATNTYTGATTLSAGTLSAAATANLGAAAANLVFDGGTLQITGTALTSFSGIGHAVSFNSGKTVGIDINSSSNTFTGDQVLNQGAGGLTKLGAGRLVLNQNNTFSGDTTISAGAIIKELADSTSGNISVANNATFVLKGGINDGAGQSISINGPGANSADYFYAGSAVQRGSLQAQNGSNTWAGNIVINGTTNTRIGVQNGASLTLSGDISESVAGSTLSFRAGNAGDNIILSGNGSWTGTTTFFSNGGAIRITGNNRISTSSAGYFSATGSTVFDLNGYNQEFAGFSSDGSSITEATITNTASSTTSTLTSNTPSSTTFTYKGGIADGAGKVSLTKTGLGTQVLTNASTYTGATTISQGTLALSATGTIANTSTIHIANGATLDVSAAGISIGATQAITGTGTILATGTTVTANGTLSPGNSPGTLIQDGGTLQLGASGDLNWQVYDASGTAGSGYDTVNLTNGATLDLSLLSNINTYNINLWSLSGISPDTNGAAINFDNTLDYTWTLFSTNNAIAGFDPSYFNIFTGSNNGTSGFANALGIGSFSVALSDSDTDLVLKFTAVPEPNVAALLGGLGTLALMRRRRVS